jgi:hypothetical protein
VQQRTDERACVRHDEGIKHIIEQESIMGKYVLGWLLGIPAVVLVVIYFIAN